MGFEFRLLVGRAVCLLFAAVAFTVIIKAPNMNNFSSFMFLAVASFVQIAWSAIRLVFQVACLWFGRAQPSNTALTVLVVLELIVAIATMAAAGCSALGIAVLLDLDLGDCGDLVTSACTMYLTASTFAVIDGIIAIFVTLGLQWLLGLRYLPTIIPI